MNLIQPLTRREAELLQYTRIIINAGLPTVARSYFFLIFYDYDNEAPKHRSTEAPKNTTTQA